MHDHVRQIGQVLERHGLCERKQLLFLPGYIPNLLHVAEEVAVRLEYPAEVGQLRISGRLQVREIRSGC
jgi:hypothetical protein